VVLVVAEPHEEDRAVSVAVAVEHHADEVDPQDAEASAAVEEVVVSAVAAAAVVSQEVDVVAAVASVVDVDEEATKCFDVGRLVCHSDQIARAQQLALPSQFGPTITYRYHDHSAAFWSCDGLSV
jgi:hypothetical protein